MIQVNDNVLTDKKIPSNAKLLLGYVQSNGEVSDTNSQLAQKFGVTPVSITNWVSRLEKAGYVTLLYERRKRTIKSVSPVV
jgi:DNA-binding MarR family transcriptional regulator